MEGACLVQELAGELLRSWRWCSSCQQQSKNHKYFLDFVNAFSETVSPHTCILSGTAGLWPMATVPGTLPQGLFPKTLIIQTAHLTDLWRGHTRHMVTQYCTGKGKKTYATLNSKEIWFIVCRPLNYQASLAPQGRRDTTILYPASRTLVLDCLSWWLPTASTQIEMLISHPKGGNYGKGNGKRQSRVAEIHSHVPPS